jgi:hypothetical protein
LTVFTSLKIEVSFSVPEESDIPSVLNRNDGPTFEAILSDSLLNYEASRNWRIERGINTQVQVSPCMDANAFRVSLDKTGMYEISYSDLATQGWPSGIDVDVIRMCYQDKEIAIRVEEGSPGNGFFDGSDLLIFYGQAIKTQETTTNVYWLTYINGSNGKRIDHVTNTAGGLTRDSYQTNYHLEQDAEYYSLMPTSDANDHWYWRKTLYGKPGDPDQSMTVDFSMPDPVKDGSTFPLKVMIWGYFRSESHRVEVRFNNDHLASKTSTDPRLAIVLCSMRLTFRLTSLMILVKTP